MEARARSVVIELHPRAIGRSNRNRRHVALRAAGCDGRGVRGGGVTIRANIQLIRYRRILRWFGRRQNHQT